MVSKRSHALGVEDRAFLGESVRPFGLQLVREIARRDVDGTAICERDGVRDDLAEAVVLRGREPREADAHDLAIRLDAEPLIRVAEKSQRYHRRVVEPRRALRLRARREILGVELLYECLDEIRVIIHGNLEVRCAEILKASCGG